MSLLYIYFLPNTYITPLISAIIGGFLTISGSVLTQIVINKKERTSKFQELKSKEIRISYLIERYHYYLIHHAIESTRYSRLSTIFANQGLIDQRDAYYQNSISHSNNIVEIHHKISLAISDYLSTITHCLSLLDKKINLEDEIHQLLNFNIETYYEFDEIKKILDQKILEKKLEEEKEKLTNYIKSELVNYFNTIRNQIN